MLKRSIIIVLLMLISVPGLPGKPEEEEFRGRKIPQLPFYIFTYREHKSYYILSGYMGDVRDLKIMKIKEKQSGKRCMKVIYKPEFNMQRSGWSGLYWQYPANNWGNSPKGGYDLSGANFLYFYARGTKGEEAIEFKIGGIQGSYGDSDDITTGLILLTKKWTLYKIDLRERNLKNIIGGFGIIMASHYHPEGLSFFL
ncbi:MAG: hypothetical protein KKH98_00330, partial [Spirochaetes bacterium]|nr:hypothetical protein [Spirochaetota bacterium]